MRQPWQGQEAAAGGAITPLREWIIDLYAPYVLIRCAGFTNDRSQALMIGAYTLVTTCLMVERLDHLGQLGISVDVVVEVVGPDVIGGAEDPSSRRGGELLIPDERMQDLAEALNLLERPLREAVVLHYLGGLAENRMARVLNRPAADIAAQNHPGRAVVGPLSERVPHERRGHPPVRCPATAGPIRSRTRYAVDMRSAEWRHQLSRPLPWSNQPAGEAMAFELIPRDWQRDLQMYFGWMPYFLIL